MSQPGNLRTRLPRRAFTLVELLVVVSILGLLMAILLPSLSRARQQAASVACTSNLHQQYMAAQLYATDYRDALPYAKNYDWEKYTYPGLYYAQYVQDAVIPFIGGTKASDLGLPKEVAFSRVFRCPAVNRRPTVDWLVPPDQNHYRYNTHKAIINATKTPRLTSSVLCPPRAVVFYDVVFPDWPEKQFPHRGIRQFLNVAYMDGHANSVSAEEYLKNSPKAAFKDEAKNPFVGNGWDKLVVEPPKP